jgi:hypothetical protein
MGGIFLDETQLRPLKDAMDVLCTEAGVPAGTELKWSPPRGNWIRDQLKGPARTELYCRVVRTAREMGGRAVVVVWDTGRTRLQGPDALRRVVRYLFERVTMHLEDRGQRGIIVADRPSGGGRRDEDALLEDVVGPLERGTNYVKSTQIVMNLVTTPSHLSRYLQVADLIVGCATSMVAGDGQFAPPLFDEVRPMLVANAWGYAGGAGFKLFPDDLLNLYFHVLRESTFVKTAMNTGIGLPWRKLPYYYDGTDASPRTDARGDRAVAG